MMKRNGQLRLTILAVLAAAVHGQSDVFRLFYRYGFDDGGIGDPQGIPSQTDIEGLICATNNFMTNELQDYTKNQAIQVFATEISWGFQDWIYNGSEPEAPRNVPVIVNFTTIVTTNDDSVAPSNQEMWEATKYFEYFSYIMDYIWKIPGQNFFKDARGLWYEPFIQQPVSGQMRESSQCPGAPEVRPTATNNERPAPTEQTPILVTPAPTPATTPQTPAQTATPQTPPPATAQTAAPQTMAPSAAAQTPPLTTAQTPAPATPAETPAPSAKTPPPTNTVVTPSPTATPMTPIPTAKTPGPTTTPQTPARTPGPTTTPATPSPTAKTPGPTTTPATPSPTQIPATPIPTKLPTKTPETPSPTEPPTTLPPTDALETPSPTVAPQTGTPMPSVKQLAQLPGGMGGIFGGGGQTRPPQSGPSPAEPGRGTDVSSTRAPTPTPLPSTAPVTIRPVARPQTPSDDDRTLEPTKKDEELVYFNIKMGFFDGMGREPEADEVEAMICQTNKFFKESIKKSTNDPNVESYATNIDWEYEPDESLPMTVYFTSHTTDGNGAIVPAADMYSYILEDADAKALISDYIWNSEPYPSNIFYQTQDIKLGGSYSDAKKGRPLVPGKLARATCPT